MRHVDLCSGIGGFALGFEWAELSKPVLFCDIEPWSRKVLRKHWPNVPIAEDVKELASDPDRFVPDCEIITAGYPCQPFSIAGERRGDQDDRHIWPFIFSIIQAKRPSWCVFENVYGHVSMGLDEVLFDLEGEGYTARPFIVPACAVDAPHRRDRVWIVARNVANSKSFSRHDCKSVRKISGESREIRKSRRGGFEDILANADGERLQGQRRKPELVSERKTKQATGSSCKENRSRKFWLPEPPVGRVANGVPRRVDRLRGLGNAIVPQIAQRIGETIKQAQKNGEAE
jgi:DNA (cytosine-5)-methyltransferase 1